MKKFAIFVIAAVAAAALCSCSGNDSFNSSGATAVTVLAR